MLPSRVLHRRLVRGHGVKDGCAAAWRVSRMRVGHGRFAVYQHLYHMRGRGGAYGRLSTRRGGLWRRWQLVATAAHRWGKQEGVSGRQRVLPAGGVTVAYRNHPPGGHRRANGMPPGRILCRDRAGRRLQWQAGRPVGVKHRHPLRPGDQRFPPGSQVWPERPDGPHADGARCLDSGHGPATRPRSRYPAPAGRRAKAGGPISSRSRVSGFGWPFSSQPRNW